MQPSHTKGRIANGVTSYANKRRSCVPTIAFEKTPRRGGRSDRDAFLSLPSLHVAFGFGSCCCTDAHFACSCETRDSILSANNECGSGAFP